MYKLVLIGIIKNLIILIINFNDLKIFDLGFLYFLVWEVSFLI